MKNKVIISIIVFCILLCVFLVWFVIIPKYKELKEEKVIKEAVIEVKLVDNLSIPFNEEVKVSDMISSINGKIIDDKYINTKSIGNKIVKFKYMNDDGIEIPYQFKVNIYDDVKPIIWLGDSYSINTNYSGDLEKDIMCADNETSKLNCFIEGEYDTKVVGNYNLVYKAIDNSGNTEEKSFVLRVKEPSNSSNNRGSVYQKYSDIVNKYKTDKTQIGIDVSGYQGEIDYQVLKDNGVEFAFIKVGGEKGIDGEYYLDSKFVRNIEGFNDVGIPVGVYIYSFAKNTKQAKEEALWIMEQIKDYQVDLPIVFDWENWTYYNYFDISLFDLSEMARVFVETVEGHGYNGSVYGSKNYLEKVWLKTYGEVWLAHYNSSTSYQGDYKYWQICDNGRIEGINAAVDINIRYLNN